MTTPTVRLPNSRPARNTMRCFVESVRTGLTELRHDERGSAAAELTLITPLLILLLLFVVLCGRLADTKLRIDDVAHQAARAATLARSPSQATAAAQATANPALASAGITCQSLSVATDTQGLRPGSTVTVTISCTVGLGDLTMLDVPGTRTFESSFSSPVDVWRGTSPVADTRGLR
jgi:Flp pilus assembly protein TadG